VLHRLNPLVQIYLPDRLITVSHLLYGTALASYPSFVRQLQWVAESDLGATDPAGSNLSAAPVPPPIPAPVVSDVLMPEHPLPESPESAAALEPPASDQEVGGSIP
jgi:hypothetical protein